MRNIFGTTATQTKNRHVYALLLAFVLVSSSGFAENLSNAVAPFQLIALGTQGDLDESNLTAFLLGTTNSDTYIALDAGTIYSGINRALARREFPPNLSAKQNGLEPAANIIKNHVQAYLITHAHLDHIAGMVFATALGGKKSILATPETIASLSDDVFNWKIWPNFADQGKAPFLKMYQYVTLSTGEWAPVPNTNFSAMAYTLSHGNSIKSTAYLIRFQENYLLFLGDTGADTMEHSQGLAQLWKAIAPLIQKHALKGIMLECSFLNDRPNDQLYGHLKPELLLQELGELAKLVSPTNPNKALESLPVIITHVKFETNQNFEATRVQVLNELLSGNTWGANFILP